MGQIATIERSRLRALDIENSDCIIDGHGETQLAWAMGYTAIKED